ncbi:MAG TPA: biliverdin-producing heme oxygenase [Kofleriaceae bacterium]|nr:biliverdin-producing heme oxygenase [Kofleriaceae bacterium]
MPRPRPPEPEPEPAQERGVVARRRPAGLHARLREGTGAQHRVLDDALGFLLDPALTLERYRQVLAAYYGLYVPLEVRLRDLRQLADVPGAYVPDRSRLLAEDLEFLGMPSAQRDALPLCEEPALAGRERLAGALYVVSGASLGGSFIARSVEHSLGVRAHAGASFFVGDGPDTGKRWKQVLCWLEALAAGGAAEDEILTGARQTFELFTRWLRQRRVFT